MKKWLKNIIIIVPTIAILLSGLFWINNFIVNKSKREITKYVTDSLQNETIKEVKESIGNANGRIDVVQSKQNLQEQINTKLIDKLDYNNKVLLIIAGKIDKTLIPLLQDKQSERLKIDSLNNQRKYIYNDSLSVMNNPLKYILFIN